MSDLASVEADLYMNDASFRSGLGKSFMQKLGKLLNFALDETNNNWLLCGSSGTFTNPNNSLSAVTNQSGTLRVIANRLIVAGVIPDGSSNPMDLAGGGSGTDLSIEIKTSPGGIFVDQFNILALSQLSFPVFALPAGTYAFRLLCAAEPGSPQLGSAQYLRMFVRQW